jgi:hypothetical protein
MHDRLPDAKLIVLLRDPLRRAYSHYRHERDKGCETLSFEEAIAAETERLGNAEQPDRWFTVFPRGQFLVLRFEDLAREPLEALNTTLYFLELPRVASVSLEARNTRKYPPLADATAAQLRDYFEPHNQRLEKLLGRPMGW